MHCLYIVLHNSMIGLINENSWFEIILANSSTGDFTKSKLTFDGPEWFLHIDSEMIIRDFNQIIKPDFIGVRGSSVHSGFHGDSHLDLADLECITYL